MWYIKPVDLITNTLTLTKQFYISFKGETEMRLYTALDGNYPNGKTVWLGLADTISEAVEFAKRETGNQKLTFENVGLA